jgi:DNA-binding MarR family transcriptional regulator
MDLTSVTPSPAGLKALSHPVRLQMLGLLRVDGPATATTLAAQVGINTGAASYHLRQLAQHGFIEDAPERGNARDRWWQATHQSTLAGNTADTDDERQTIDAYLQSVAVVYTQNLQAAIEERAGLSDAWRLASTFSDYYLRLTPSKARALTQRMHEMLREVHESTIDVESGKDADAGEDVADFVVQFSAYPRPQQNALDPS